MNNPITSITPAAPEVPAATAMAWFGGVASKDVGLRCANPTYEAVDNTKETPKKHPKNAKEQILIALRVTPSLSVAALAGVLNKTPNGIRHHLRTLQAAGRIRHVGPTKAGHWEVLEAGQSTEVGRDKA